MVLTSVASQSPELMETVDECAIKYSDDTAIDPLYRLAMHVGQLSLAIHTSNSARSAAVSESAIPAGTSRLAELSKGL